MEEQLVWAVRVDRPLIGPQTKYQSRVIEDIIYYYTHQIVFSSLLIYFLVCMEEELVWAVRVDRPLIWPQTKFFGRVTNTQTHRTVAI